MITPEAALRKLKGKLVGITDHAIEQHVALWAQEIDTLDALRYELVRGHGRTAPPAPGDADVRALMRMRIRDLDLKIEGQLAECVAEVEGELASRGITWRPRWYIGTSGFIDGEFWTTDRANSINIPWYLANDRVWRYVNDAKVHYTKEDVMRVLRHETGHALGYAFELWKRTDWRETFGDFNKPYDDSYQPDPTSRNFVRYLHLTGPSQNSHYAQKHPDEDWAETFAVWLDPASEWRVRYAGWPAMAKLAYVDYLINGAGAAYGEPTNKDPGKPEPYTRMPGTVGEFVGGWDTADFGVPAGGMVRREAALVNEVALHALYFEGLGGEPGVGASPRLRAQLAPGDEWERQVRVCAAATEGWVVTCWFAAEGRCRTLALLDGWQGPPAGGVAIYALDMHEHAWWGDFPGRKDLYVAACLKQVDWAVIDANLSRASMSRPVMQLPEKAQVAYAGPNLDGSRKRCGNCWKWDPEGGCLEVSGEIKGSQVCTYHVFGKPSRLVNHATSFKMSPEVAGLIETPSGEGTSCDICVHYFNRTPDPPVCTAVRQGMYLAVIQPLACCGRWDQ